MFVVGKMFETVEEAKAWMETQTPSDDRREWIILQLGSEEHPPGLEGVKGLKPDGKLQ